MIESSGSKPSNNLTQGLLIGTLAIVIIAWIFRTVRNWRLKRKRLVDVAEKLPGAKGLPLIGNSLQFACKPEQLFDRIVQAIIPYQDITPMRLWFGPSLRVVVAEPRDIEVLLNSRQSTLRSSSYRLMQPFIGDGLVSGSGHSWRSYRKLFAPMLNGRTVTGFGEIVQKHSEILVEKLKPVADGIEFDIGPYLTRCTTDLVCETVMGCRDSNAQDNPDHEFLHATERMYELIYDRMMKIWFHPDWIYRLSPGYQDQIKCQRVIHGFVEKLITAKRKEIAESSNGELSGCDSLRNSMLERVIQQIEQDKSILNDEELRNEIFAIYTASQDTIALIGSFALLMLGGHEDVQDNVRSELKRVLQEDAEDIPPSSLSQLKYLEMVIKETLRLFPIAPFMGRALRGDLALDTCVLPEGCEIIIASYLTHKTPRFWKNPDQFIPERFTTEEIALRHPYAYVPFSGGLMSCIGQKFAITSLKLIVANVVRRYRIGSSVRMGDVKLKSDISIRSVNGYRLSLEPCRL